MSNANRIISPFIPGGNPDSMNVASLYAPGTLGDYFEYNGNCYGVVQVDSGATASTPVGVVAANQLAFWKDKTNRIVTNDFRVAIGGSLGTNAPMNQVAGVFRCAATAGYFTNVLVKGSNIPVASNATGAVGSIAVADTTAAKAQVIGTAVATAAPYQIVGIERSAVSGGNVNVDVDIPVVP